MVLVILTFRFRPWRRYVRLVKDYEDMIKNYARLVEDYKNMVRKLNSQQKEN